jgi:hypothetical protein
MSPLLGTFFPGGISPLKKEVGSFLSFFGRFLH